MKVINKCLKKYLEKNMSLEGKQKVIANYNSLITEYPKITNLLYNSLN